MRFRTGVAIGATAHLAGRGVHTASRRLHPVKVALTGVHALSERRSPVLAPRGAGWTTLKETLPGIFGSRGAEKFPTTIVEQIDIGAPRRLVYDQWTLFREYPSFMKKVVTVDQTADEKLNWKARIFWSSRRWQSTIIEQIPDEHIVWSSDGRVDGTVSFHELAPDLTRVLLVIEYRPCGLMERVGNLWRAQGRRTRLELKHFRRHVMTRSLRDPDRVDGWRGEIRDGRVLAPREPARSS